MDTRILQKIGLTEGETKVYLALLQIGSTTTGPIVDAAKVSRSKIYHILVRLIEKGLVTSIIKANTKYFQAADPQRLLDFLNTREKELQENKKEVLFLIPQLQLHKKMAVEEEAEIYHGIEGIKTARELALKVLKKGDTFYCLAANKINLQALQVYWHDFHKRRAKIGIFAKYLIQEDSRQKMGFGSDYKDQNLLIESRYLDHAGPVHIDIFGDYVVTCIMRGTYTSFLIKNKYVADYYRDYFEKAWKVAKT